MASEAVKEIHVIKKDGDKIENLCTLYTTSMKGIMKDTHGAFYKHKGLMILQV